MGRRSVSGVTYAILSALLLSWSLGRDSSGADRDPRFDPTRQQMAEACVKEIKRLAPTRSFFTIKEHVLLGMWFSPDDKIVLKYQDYYSFVPSLPNWFYGEQLTWESLPESRDLRKQKHDRRKDAELLAQFFGTGLDALLCTYLDKLEALKGFEDEASKEALGNEVLRIDEFVSDDWLGGPVWRRFVSLQLFGMKKERLLTRLGFVLKKFSDSENEVGTWMGPSKLREFLEQEAVQQKWKSFTSNRTARMAEKFAALANPGEVEEMEGPSEIEKGIDAKLRKWRSRHYAVQGRLTDGNVQELLRVLEAGFSFLAGTLRAADPGRLEKPVLCVVLGSPELYEKYWSAAGSPAPGTEREKTLKTRVGFDGSKGAMVFEYGVCDPYMRDQVTCRTLERTLAALGIQAPPRWLSVGLRCHLTLELLGVADTSIPRMPENTRAADYFRWVNYYAWKQTLKDAEGAGKAPATLQVLGRTAENETHMDVIKMYCLVQFLLIEEPEKLLKLLAVADPGSWTPGADGEFAAFKAAGWSFQAFDEAFAKFIRQ